MWVSVVYTHINNEYASSQRSKCCGQQILTTVTMHIVADESTDDAKPILGDPGAVSGGGKKSKRARKKIGRRKVKNENRSPWDSTLNRPVPKPFKILACDWAQKIFLCPIRVQLFSCYFRDFLFEGVHRQTLACSPFIYLLVQESFPRSKSAIEAGTMKPKKNSKFSMFVNQPEKASTEKIRLWTNRR